MKASEVFTRYPNQYTGADVEAARKWLEAVKLLPANGVFASFHKGAVKKEMRNGPCHGSISHIAPHGPLIASLTKSRENPGYGSTGHHITLTNPELAERWFTWLLYDTYWSRFYVETTVDQAMSSGLLVPSTLPANLMQGCNIITRHNHEHPNSIKAWGMLVDAGMEPDLAYLCVFCWGLTEQSITLNMPIGFIPLGHNAMGMLTPSVLRNFLERNYNNLLKPLYKNLGVSFGMSSHVPFDEGQGIITFYGEYPGMGSSYTCPAHILSTVKHLNSYVKKEETSSVVSPFAKKKVVAGTIGGMERPGAKLVLDNAKSIQEWLLKEFINE